MRQQGVRPIPHTMQDLPESGGCDPGMSSGCAAARALLMRILDPVRCARDDLRCTAVPGRCKRRMLMKTNGFLVAMLGSASLVGACELGGEPWEPELSTDEIVLADEDVSFESQAVTDQGWLTAAWEEDEEGMLGDELVVEDDYGTLECGQAEFVGAGSCTGSCYREGSCANNQPKWKCQVFNYEHWRTCYWWGCSNSYWRSGGPFDYTFCANSNPANCPGFCN
jgi:hypothetical protein